MVTEKLKQAEQRMACLRVDSLFQMTKDVIRIGTVCPFPAYSLLLLNVILAPITAPISASPQSDQTRGTPSMCSSLEMRDDKLRPSNTSTEGEPHGARTFNFLKPPPPSMSSEDIEYLVAKGAFSIPAADFRREILQSYIDFVHPFIPILDLWDIVAMAGHGESGEVSVLLLQAVLLAGSLYVGMAHLKNAGYLTRRSARKDFHDRARVRMNFSF
jgi:hypothetical protein